MVSQNEPESNSDENLPNDNPAETNLSGVASSQNLLSASGILVIFGNFTISAGIVIQINGQAPVEIVEAITNAIQGKPKTPPPPPPSTPYSLLPLDGVVPV